MTRNAVLLIVLYLAVIVGGSVYLGVRSDRWGESDHLVSALGKLSGVPNTIGEWTGTEIEFNREDMVHMGIQGWVSRQYQNGRTGETVSMLLVCGKGGPISVHTPEVCYAGAGYSAVSAESEATLSNIEGQEESPSFKVRRFNKKDREVPETIEIYWSWSVDGVNWEAPDNARGHLAREPALYKLYVVRRVLVGGQAEKVNSCEDFLRKSLPVLRAVLSGTK